MQPGSQSEDIQNILGRFHTWAGKNPGNGNKKKMDAESGTVREIPYEEAMRKFRQRQKTQTRPATRPNPAPPAAAPPVAAAQSVAAAPATPPEPTPAIAEETLPVPAAAAPQPVSVLLTAPPEASAEPAALVRRLPAFVTKAATKAEPTVASGRKQPERKKPVDKTKAVSSPALLPAVIPALPRAVRARRKASVQCKPEPRRAAPARVPAKKCTALAVRPHAVAPTRPVFKKVLAKTVRSAAPSAPGKRKALPAPDRNRRITTRFSTAEQRRLERAAAQAGLTVSAWLRQCALLAETAAMPPLSLGSPVKKIQAAASLRPPGSTLFSTPAPSGLGNWLTLLRQRFLSSPARLSERA